MKTLCFFASEYSPLQLASRYLDLAKVPEDFAADLPADQAAFIARSQVLSFAENFKAVITQAAWKNKPRELVR